MVVRAFAIAVALACVSAAPVSAEQLETGAGLRESDVTEMYVVKRSNVRAGPGASYRKIDLLEEGEAVRVISEAGGWYQLEPRGGQPRRFVHGSLLVLADSGAFVRTYAFGNGDRYRGSMRNGVPHGRGVYTWADGTRYEGRYVDGVRSGRGMFAWPDGDSYLEKWSDGMYLGQVDEPDSPCLEIDRVNAGLAYWVNRCSAGIDVIWYDEVGCRSRGKGSFACASFVGAGRQVAAAIEGHVWRFECVSPHGIGDVIAVEKHGRAYCMDSVGPQTQSRRERLERRAERLLRVALRRDAAGRERGAGGRDRVIESVMGAVFGAILTEGSSVGGPGRERAGRGTVDLLATGGELWWPPGEGVRRTSAVSVLMHVPSAI